MVRQVDSGGSEEFSMRSQKEASLHKLSQGSTKIGKLITSHTKNQTSYTLKGHVTSDFKATDYLQKMKKI